MSWLEWLAEELSRQVRDGTPGHVIRVDGLQTQDARYVARSMRGQVAENDLVAVVAHEPAEDTDISVDRAVEWRNEKRYACIFFVPVELEKEAAASLSDVARIAVTDVLDKVAKRRERQVPDDVRELVHEACLRTPASRRLDFLAALGDSPDKEQVGLNLWRLGLVPDMSPTVSRIKHNRIVVHKLMSPGRGAKSLSRRLLDAGVTNTEDLTSLVEVLSQEPLAEGSWLAKLAEPVHREQAFQSWEFGEAQDKPITEIRVLPFCRPDGRPFAWSGLKKTDQSLWASVQPDAKSTRVTVRWETEPPNPASEPQYIVSVMPDGTDEEPLLEEVIQHKPTRSGYQTWRFTPADLSEQISGSLRVVVRIALITSDTGEDGTAEDIVESLSEQFLLRQQEEPEISRGPSRYPPTRSLADAMLERVVFSRSPVEIEHLSVEEDTEVRLVLSGHHRRRIDLAPFLAHVERRALASPDNWGRFLIEMDPDISVDNNYLQVKDRPEDGWSWESKRSFFDHRRQVFSIISKEFAPGLVEGADLTQEKLRNSILKYVQAYANILADFMQDRLTEEESDPAQCHALLSIDSLEVWHRERPGMPAHRLGLLILPTHPLRLFWHLCHAELLNSWIKQLAQGGRRSVRPEVNPDTAQLLDGANFPLFVALEPGTLLTYADSLNFFWPVLVPVETEFNRNRALAQMRRGLCVGGDETQPTDLDVGSRILTQKMKEYMSLHPYVRTLLLNCINIGDGKLAVDALAELEETREDTDFDEDDTREEGCDYEVRLYGEDDTSAIGSYFDRLAERRQRGSIRSGPLARLFGPTRTALRPHLFWAKRPLKKFLESPPDEAHLSIASGLFHAAPMALEPDDSADDMTSLYVHGLRCRPRVDFAHEALSDGDAGVGEFLYRWRRQARFPENWPLEPHPVDKAYSTWLVRSISRLTELSGMVFAGSDEAKVPCSEVRLDAEAERVIALLHDTSDWVITIDRELSIDLFDSPTSTDPRLKENARRYLIDFAPEYLYGNGRRVMVSTAWVDEVAQLLRTALQEMLISATDMACEEVLRLLKSISGRLVMHLAASPAATKEAVGLAVAREVLRAQGELAQAFLIPADNHRELFKQDLTSQSKDSGERRPDLLLVHTPTKQKKDICIDFIEVKYRRHRQIAESTGLWAEILDNSKTAERAFRTRFFPGEECVRLDLPITRDQLCTLMAFYCERAARHGLLEEADQSYFARWLTSTAPRNDLVLTVRHQAFIYCPELPYKMEQRKYQDLEVTLIGPEALPHYTTLQPDLHISTPRTCEGSLPDVDTPKPSGAEATAPTAAQPAVPAISEVKEKHAPADECRVLVGREKNAGHEVFFAPTIRANPHLLMLGIPGMGKTTAVANLCAQLAGSGIAPFVVDFHGDLARILGENCGTKPAHVLQAHDGVPFNPLELDTMRRSERQGWLKQVYELAEIIADIFPAFGELQQDTIRTVLSDVYKAAGFNNDPAGDREAPLPEALWERLQQLEKSERDVRKINARLSGMFEFNLFAPEREHALPLEDILSQPCILNLSQVTPEDNQRVAASLFLHRIYRWMFSRSGADGLSNALIFDEAHRVAKLKLIPRMMQECRKYGFLFVLSSQRLDDFDQGVIDTAGTQFILKVNYPDARRIANHLAAGVDAKEYVGRLQNLSRYHAIYRTEGDTKVREILLVDPSTGVELA